ncbi:MAG: CSLREA domain-containing protein, partial [Pyrinomonadaceae bacterium]
MLAGSPSIAVDAESTLPDRYMNSPGNAGASTALILTVTKTADTNDGACNADCSLREAIGAANSVASDDTIQFDPSVFSTPQIIALTSGQLPVCNNGTLTINGTGSTQLVISGSNQSRVLRVFPGGNATLNGVTIADGNTGFGPFTGCPAVGTGDASFGGGGIENAGTLFINNSVIRNNLTNSGAAGGIANAYGKLTLTNSAVRNNRAGLNYGGIGNFGFGTPLPVTVTIVNSQIINNEATGANVEGGGG